MIGWKIHLRNMLPGDATGMITLATASATLLEGALRRAETPSKVIIRRKHKDITTTV